MGAWQWPFTLKVFQNDPDVHTFYPTILLICHITLETSGGSFFVNHRVSLCPYPLSTLSPSSTAVWPWSGHLISRSFFISCRCGQEDWMWFPALNTALHTAGILQLTERAVAVRAARATLPLHQSFSLSYFLGRSTAPGSGAWKVCPSHANTNNSSSGKPLWALPHHHLIALSSVSWTSVSMWGLCPRPDCDEIRLKSSPGHQRKQTNYWAPISGKGIFLRPYLSEWHRC